MNQKLNTVPRCSLPRSNQSMHPPQVPNHASTRRSRFPPTPRSHARGKEIQWSLPILLSSPTVPLSSGALIWSNLSFISSQLRLLFRPFPSLKFRTQVPGPTQDSTIPSIFVTIKTPIATRASRFGGEALGDIVQQQPYHFVRKQDTARHSQVSKAGYPQSLLPLHETGIIPVIVYFVPSPDDITFSIVPYCGWLSEPTISFCECLQFQTDGMLFALIMRS
ncbi:hypothetical protein VTI74DRAFT_4757 [Chaetomium olivicolor]